MPTSRLVVLYQPKEVHGINQEQSSRFKCRMERPKRLKIVVLGEVADCTSEEVDGVISLDGSRCLSEVRINKIHFNTCLFCKPTCHFNVVGGKIEQSYLVSTLSKLDCMPAPTSSPVKKVTSRFRLQKLKYTFYLLGSPLRVDTKHPSLPVEIGFEKVLPIHLFVPF